MNHRHAVTALSNGNTYGYDSNGNMTQRVVGGQSYTLSYDAENHMTGVSGAAAATFTYNGDGQRIVASEGVTTTVYLSNYVELAWNSQTQTLKTKKYYYAGTTRVAMRQGGAAPLLVLGDHLGSTSRVVNYEGSPIPADQLYYPWGENRFTNGSMPTQYQFTGQYRQAAIGLDYFNARWYDPALGRFAQADTIIPEAAQGVLAWDRYLYSNANPVRWNDPSGHAISDGCETEGCSADEAQINYDKKRQYYEECIQGQGSCPPALEYIYGTHRSIGIRFDASGWFSLLGKSIGGDLNLSLVYFADTREWGVFVSPGPQFGEGAGLAWTVGPEFGVNMMDSSSYSGGSAVMSGGDLPIAPAGLSIEADQTVGKTNSDGSIPMNTYLGVGPLQLEYGIYAGGGYTIDLVSIFRKLFG